MSLLNGAAGAPVAWRGRGSRQQRRFPDVEALRAVRFHDRRNVGARRGGRLDARCAARLACPPLGRRCLADRGPGDRPGRGFGATGRRHRLREPDPGGAGQRTGGLPQRRGRPRRRGPRRHRARGGARRGRGRLAVGAGRSRRLRRDVEVDPALCPGSALPGDGGGEPVGGIALYALERLRSLPVQRRLRRRIRQHAVPPGTAPVAGFEISAGSSGSPDHGRLRRAPARRPARPARPASSSPSGAGSGTGAATAPTSPAISPWITRFGCTGS